MNKIVIFLVIFIGAFAQAQTLRPEWTFERLQATVSVSEQLRGNFMRGWVERSVFINSDSKSYELVDSGAFAPTEIYAKVAAFFASEIIGSLGRGQSGYLAGLKNEKNSTFLPLALLSNESQQITFKPTAKDIRGLENVDTTKLALGLTVSVPCGTLKNSSEGYYLEATLQPDGGAPVTVKRLLLRTLNPSVSTNFVEIVANNAAKQTLKDLKSKENAEVCVYAAQVPVRPGKFEEAYLPLRAYSER